MDRGQYCQEQQEAKRLHSRISSLLEDCKVGTLLGGSGIRKLRGVTQLAVFTSIFALPFGAINFSRGIVNHRCCGYTRRREAMGKSMNHLESTVERVLVRGIRANCLLMDSWFAFPSILATLGKHLLVICMGKDMPKVVYSSPEAMAALGSFVEQTEEASRQGADSRQRGCRDQERAEDKDRFCPSPPQAPVAGHPVDQVGFNWESGRTNG